MVDRRLLVLVVGMFALGTDSYVVAGVLPQISVAFDISISAAGQMTTVYALTYALSAPTIAALAASVSRKGLLLSGLGIFVVANLATAAAPSFALALLSRIFAGVGAAIFSPLATGAGSMLVPPERRGFALSVTLSGLTAATALGSPTGALIGGLADWRWTMVYVAGLGSVSLFGVWALLPKLPEPPAVHLRERLAPLADVRVGLTLATTLFAMSGIFIVYTYFSAVFERAIGESPMTMSILLLTWGAAGTCTNLLTGHLIDAIGSRAVIMAVLIVLAVDMTLMPWASANLWTATLAIGIWGACSWGVPAPQQHRLVNLAPSIAPVLIGLNTACVHFGMSAAGLVGGIALRTIGTQYLSLIGAGLIALAAIMSEITSRQIATSRVSRSDRVELS
jgi:MFS transporter, DHA1 family, inner membrane transport protein